MVYMCSIAVGGGGGVCVRCVYHSIAHVRMHIHAHVLSGIFQVLKIEGFQRAMPFDLELSRWSFKALMWL